MGEPKRLLEGDASAMERLLLSSADDDGPSIEAKRRAFTSLGVPAPSTLPSQPPPGMSWSLWKWAAAGAGLALVVLPALVTLVRSNDAPAVARAVPMSLPEAPPPDSSPSPSSVPIASTRSPTSSSPPPAAIAIVARHPTAPVEKVSAASSAPATPVVEAPPDNSLRTETTLLESVRRALAVHDSLAATRTLDDYDARFLNGVLRPEATVLRIQLLLASGDRARAQSLATRFVDADPSGPYAHRVRELLRE